MTFILTRSRLKMSKRSTETTSPEPSVRIQRRIFIRKHGLKYRFQGRIAGQDGKTKFTIENTSRTRIILADTSVDIFSVHRIENLKFSSQKNSHPWFFPKHQSCPRCYRLIDSWLTTRKGIRRPAHRGQPHEAESALGFLVDVHQDDCTLISTCTARCKLLFVAADQNYEQNV